MDNWIPEIVGIKRMNVEIVSAAFGPRPLIDAFK